MADPGERLDVLDELGAHVGVERRDVVHRDGLWHRCFHLWVLSGGGVLLQRRAADKDAFGGMLDATAAGHLLAGESVADGVREAEEELGVAFAPQSVALRLADDLDIARGDLLAAVVPIAIHLLNRRRHKTIHWAAMQFLLKATRESRGKKKLRHILILTCRALAIAALFLAAAQPIVSGLVGWGGSSIDTVVLLLDRSVSMETKPSDGLNPRRQIIIEKVRDAMANLGVARLVLIDSASMEPQEIPSPDILTDLAATSATDTAANFPSLLSRAAEFLAETTGRSEVWLASDLQASSWQPENERWATASASK